MAEPLDDGVRISARQARIWYLQHLNGQVASFTTGELVMLDGPLRIDWLSSALRRLCERHAVLCMAFLAEGGAVRAVRAEPGPALLVVEDGTGWDDAAVRRWAAEVSRVPFDTARGPLWRARVLSLGQDRHALLFVTHQLVADRHAVRVLVDELAAHYDEVCPANPGNVVPMDDSEDAVHAAARRLADAPAGVELPTDRLRPPVLSYRGGQVDTRVDRALLDELGTLVADDGTDGRSRDAYSLALLSAFAVLIHRYTSVDDLVIGLVEGSALVGGTANRLPVRIGFGGEPVFADMLDRVRLALDEARAHQEVPFEKLIELLVEERDPSRRPVCQIGFEVHADPVRAFGEVVAKPLDFEAGTAVLDLSLVIRFDRGGARLGFEYDADLFDEESIRRLAENYLTLLRSIAAKPDEYVARQCLLAEAQMAALTRHGIDTEVSFPRDALVHQLIAEQAALRPDAPALVTATERLTFAELNRDANRIAHHLRELGVGRAVPVGVCLPRSVEMAVAVLGVLKAGGAAVLLDPAQPVARLAMMLDDAEPPVILTTEPLLATLPGTYAGHIRCMDRDRGVLARSADHDPVESAHPLSVCQIAYTSGSTGQPRGVAFHHSAVLMVAHGTRHAYRITAADQGTWVSAPGFGISFVNELWPFLTAGAAVHVADDVTVSSPFRLRDWMVDRGVTVSLLTKVLAERVCATDWPADTPLRVLMVSGERVGWLPDTVPFEVVTIYGSTETTNATTCYNEETGTRLTPKGVPEARRRSSSSPVGLPVPNARVYLLDANLQAVPIGVPGEIYVGGELIQTGYVNRPGMTAAKWLPDPFASRPGARMVATGDIGRLHPDGALEVLGRADEQVSLNGYRVEPGEVVSRLLEHPAVRQAAVVIREDVPGTRRMVGYVVPEVNRQVTAADLRAALREQLPAYLVPSAFALLDTLPLLPNGKIDKSALSPPETTRSLTRHVEPVTRAETDLTEVWCSVLRQDHIGIHDNYFELGGDSLTGMELMAAISARFGVELALATLFEAPTVAEMARAIDQARDGDGARTADREVLPEIVAAPDARYEPFPLTDIQHAYWIGRTTGIELGDVGCHGYQEWDVDGLDTGRLAVAIDRLVRRHDMLRAIVTGDGRQRVLPEVPPYQVDVTDLRDVDPADRTARLDELRDHLSHQVLPADRWPLFDVRVTLVDETTARIHISFDLLIFDARSARIFTQELTRLYLDPDAPLPPMELTFRDYVLAERAAQDNSPLYQASREYWQSRLADLPPAPELPYLRGLGTVRNPRFTRHHGHLDPDDWRRLRQAAARAGVTPSALLLAAFAEVLGTWSASSRFTVNLTLFNRPPLHPQLNDLLGDFTSGLLHAVEQRGATFAERARDVQDRLWQDLEHRHTSSVQVLRELGRRQRGAPRAAMPVVFSSLVGVPRMEWGNLGRYAFGVTQTPQVALDHQVMEVDGGLDYCWDAVAELFPEGLLPEMAQTYGELLRALAADDAVWASVNPVRLPRHTVDRRADVNATARPVVPALLHEPFLRQVEHNPDAVAVHDARDGAPGDVTYRRLADVSAALAARLVELGAGPEQLVAIIMHKGWEQIAAVLGVLRAGAAYLPIDPALPAERIGYLLDNGRVEVVVTQHDVEVAAGGATVVVVPPDPADAVPPAEPLPSPASTPESLAYVIYTSGSTGRPKGVMIEHRAAHNTIVDINERLGVGPGDRVLALSSLSFDLSVWDIFGVLGAGGALVLPPVSTSPNPRVWAELLAEHRVTVWNSVPALLQILTDYVRGRDEGLPDCLRAVMLSGDWIPLTMHEHLREVAPEARLISLGGATEAAIWSIVHDVGPSTADWVSVPYGRPLLNQRWHVLDGRLDDRPDWVTGALFIAGDGLARGYWAEAELTEERFITHPRTGERLYRTGDLGRYRPSGELELLGREDFQVKILGHRVELGEIETALLAHPDVAACCVVALGESMTGKRLVAHVVAEPGRDPAPADLQRFLSGKLVRDVVPTLYNALPALPLTGNGKVDRSALVALGSPNCGPASDSRPATPTEAALLRIAAEVLDIDVLGPEDDFFAAGGDSLRAIAFINEAAAVGYDIPVELFFQTPSVRGLAAAVDDASPVMPVVTDMRGEH
jgi:amino acid adenylation domain-containing protein